MCTYKDTHTYAYFAKKSNGSKEKSRITETKKINHEPMTAIISNSLSLNKKKIVTFVLAIDKK